MVLCRNKNFIIAIKTKTIATIMALCSNKNIIIATKAKTIAT